MMWFAVLLLSACALADSQYGVPQPVPVPQYPPQPIYPSPFPSYGQGPRGRRPSRDSDEDDGSSSSADDCTECSRLNTRCTTQYCERPKITTVVSTKDKCQRAVVSCPFEGTFSLQTNRGEKLFEGKGHSAVIKCNKKGKWTARDVNGQKLEFSRASCVGGQSGGYPPVVADPYPIQLPPLYPPVQPEPVPVNPY